MRDFELKPCARAPRRTKARALILALTVAAAAASLVAIFVELGAARTKSPAALAALALSTVVLSWVFIHVIFAFHYAHEFYGEAKGGHKGGLKFPQPTSSPEYWDFVYFSFVIGMTFQVSDVQVTGKASAASWSATASCRSSTMSRCSR